jgi:hypothetical protein
MELDLWQAFWTRPDLQALPAEARLFLLDLGLCAASIEHVDVPDGFIPESAINFLGWSHDAAIQHVTNFSSHGWIHWTDDPAGWQIDGWLDKIKVYIPGSPDSQSLAWGQQTKAKRLKRREDSRLRIAKYRANQATQVFEESF